jgi:DNA-3-methyladenine glycosylase I
LILLQLPGELVIFIRRAQVHDLERQHAANVCVRSHAKVRAAIGKARAYLQMMEAGEDLSTFVWTLAGGEPILGTADDEVSETPGKRSRGKLLEIQWVNFLGFAY